MITSQNAREMQKRSWQTRQQNAPLRAVLAPRGLWDFSNGRPKSVAIKRAIDVLRSGGTPTLLADERFPYACAVDIFLLALYSENERTAFWGASMLLRLLFGF
jgi:hypothetical protein